jgi:CRISPR/Cas system CSM-associated protein Csm3 (group 7 of RAMP superfamily)
MNPYDFVRIDWNKPPQRRHPLQHHKFAGVSGRIEGTITTETPLFIPATRLSQIRGQMSGYTKNGIGQAIIPGSSLKGLFRSLVETIAQGCWMHFQGRYQDRVDYSRNLPHEFQPCQSINQLCPACRMFGLINRGTLFMGHINFDDATCADPVKHEIIYTPILDAPKPRHRAWYLDKSGQHVAGRKYYFHQSQLTTLSQQRTSASGVQLNQRIQPVGSSTVFDFSATFDSLNPQDELPALLYALTLEPDMRHKIGYAKPAGLGSVHVELTKIELIDYAVRYRSQGSGMQQYQGDGLQTYLDGQTRLYTNDQASITLKDLRRIWHWPPTPEVHYAYPDRNWFNDNPTEPISKT